MKLAGTIHLEGGKLNEVLGIEVIHVDYETHISVGEITGVMGVVDQVLVDLPNKIDLLAAAAMKIDQYSQQFSQSDFTSYDQDDRGEKAPAYNPGEEDVSDILENIRQSKASE